MEQILSIGAGQMDKKHELDKARKWGMTKWVRPIMDIMMDGSAGKRSLPYCDCEVSMDMSYAGQAVTFFWFICVIIF